MLVTAEHSLLILLVPMKVHWSLCITLLAIFHGTCICSTLCSTHFKPNTTLSSTEFEPKSIPYLQCSTPAEKTIQFSMSDATVHDFEVKSVAVDRNLARSAENLINRTLKVPILWKNRPKPYPF